MAREIGLAVGDAVGDVIRNVQGHVHAITLPD
jgi:hypothetical protein